MQEDRLEGIVENLMFVLPLIHKKLFRTASPAGDGNISRVHFAIMATLNEAGPQPISEVGRQLLIPKPQMTALVDRLVRMGMMERLADRDDRRVTRITLTEKGHETIMKKRQFLKDNVREKLSRLDEDGLEDLSIALSDVRNVLTKMD